MGAPDWPTIELPPGSLCIADLHLDASSARCTLEFDAFLARHPRAPALLVLGDLFEAWIGPAHVELPGGRAVFAALAAWTRAGRSLHLIHGNRDFLLGADFEAATGARVHPKGCVARVGEGRRVLCLHGDELCTRDLAYQRFKRVLRSRPLLGLAPRLPRALALGLARRLRSRSVAVVVFKPPEVKEQQAPEVERLARLAQAGTVVVGHAHHFRDQELPAARWIVLDAFGGARDVLCIGAAGELEFTSSRATP